MVQLLCGMGALSHLQDVISVLPVSHCSQEAPLVLVWHWSGRCGIFLLFLSPSDPPLPAPAFWPAVGMGGCVVVPVPGLTAALSAVQEELGRSPARSAVPLTVGEIDEQVSPQKCEAETDSILCVRSNAFQSVAVG